MQIDIFTLCDYAQNYSGKSIIIGTFNQISSKLFPFIYNAFNVVGRIGYETSGTKKLKLEILDSDKASIIPPIEWSANVPNTTPPKMSYVEFNIALNQVQFKEPGTYDVNLYSEDVVRTLKLYVTQI